MMKRAVLLALVLLTGCATMTYTSQRPASEVANCIADGWRHAAHSGYPVPVSVTETPEYLFVGVELHPTFNSPVVTGLRHPFYAVWAEVGAASDGSHTRYHRAYQFTHHVIDTVVVECQRPQP